MATNSPNLRYPLWLRNADNPFESCLWNIDLLGDDPADLTTSRKSTCVDLIAIPLKQDYITLPGRNSLSFDESGEHVLSAPYLIGRFISGFLRENTARHSLVCRNTAQCAQEKYDQIVDMGYTDEYEPIIDNVDLQEIPLPWDTPATRTILANTVTILSEKDTNVASHNAVSKCYLGASIGIDANIEASNTYCVMCPTILQKNVSRDKQRMLNNNNLQFGDIPNCALKHFERMNSNGRGCSKETYPHSADPPIVQIPEYQQASKIPKSNTSSLNIQNPVFNFINPSKKRQQHQQENYSIYSKTYLNPLELPNSILQLAYHTYRFFYTFIVSAKIQILRALANIITIAQFQTQSLFLQILLTKSKDSKTSMDNETLLRDFFPEQLAAAAPIRTSDSPTYPTSNLSNNTNQQRTDISALPNTIFGEMDCSNSFENMISPIDGQYMPLTIPSDLQSLLHDIYFDALSNHKSLEDENNTSQIAAWVESPHHHSHHHNHHPPYPFYSDNTPQSPPLNLIPLPHTASASPTPSSSSSPSSISSSSTCTKKDANKAYQCDICAKVFPRRCDVNKHRKTHDKNLFCPYNLLGACKAKGFSSEKDRRRHVQTIHHQEISPMGEIVGFEGGDQYKCMVEGCGKVCSRKDNLRDHVRRVHRTVPV